MKVLVEVTMVSNVEIDVPNDLSEDEQKKEALCLLKDSAEYEEWQAFGGFEFIGAAFWRVEEDAGADDSWFEVDL